MQAISKELFDQKLMQYSCRDFLHFKSDSCWKNYLWVVIICTPGLIKFFIPIALVRVLLDYKKLSPKYLKRFVLELIRTWVYGTGFLSVIFAYNCLSYNIAGKFNYYNIGFMGGMLAGASLFIETQANRQLDTLIFFNSVIETVFRNLEKAKMLKLTPVNQTLLFMCSSSLLMFLFKKYRIHVYPTFWFYTPSRIELTPSSKCNHDKDGIDIDCRKYWAKGAIKYFAIGYVLNIVKSGLTLTSRKGVFKEMIRKMLVSKSNLNFGFFLGGYVALYRFISCSLFKFNEKRETWWSPALAGFISGSTFLIKPNLNMISISIATILQILAVRSKILERYPKVPLIELLFMLCNGILLHHTIWHTDTCSRYYSSMVNTASNSLVSKIHKRLYKCLAA